MDTHVSIAEICDHMRISRWTVAKYLDAGELSAIKVGRNVRISVESYRQFIDRHTVPPADQRTTP